MQVRCSKHPFPHSEWRRNSTRYIEDLGDLLDATTKRRLYLGAIKWFWNPACIDWHVWLCRYHSKLMSSQSRLNEDYILAAIHVEKSKQLSQVQSANFLWRSRWSLLRLTKTKFFSKSSSSWKKVGPWIVRRLLILLLEKSMPGTMDCSLTWAFANVSVCIPKYSKQMRPSNENTSTDVPRQSSSNNNGSPEEACSSAYEKQRISKHAVKQTTRSN